MTQQDRPAEAVRGEANNTGVAGVNHPDPDGPWHRPPKDLGLLSELLPDRPAAIPAGRVNARPAATKDGPPGEDCGKIAREHHQGWAEEGVEGGQRSVPTRSPIVRRRRLASELRRLREGVHLTGGQAAKRIKWSTSKISRLETAQIVPHEGDIRTLLDLYGVVGDERERLLELARDAAKTGWWETYGDTLSEVLSTYIGLEAEAASAWTWQPVVVPGLLQTADYSRAVTRPFQPIAALPSGQIEGQTQARLTRQAILTRDDPLVFSAVIDESVLYRRFGDNSVMRAQLAQIIELARLPNVTVRVLRLDGSHPTGAGSFVLLKFQRIDHLEAIYPDVVYVDCLSGSFYEEEETETYRYEASYDGMTKSALDPDESIRLIAKAAATHWK